MTRRFGDADDDVRVRRAPLKATVLSPLRGGRVYDKIVGHVRDGILAGRLKPGDRLPPERELVRQFQVGRGAIREAFRILEQSALIGIRPGKGGGAFVAGRPTAAVIRSLSDLLRFGGIGLDDVVEARVALESLVIDIIASQAGTDDLARLAESAERAARFFEEGVVGFVGSDQVAACLPSPWSSEVMRLTLSGPLPGDVKRPPNLLSGLPWALELVSGERCTMLTGATWGGAGMRVNYGCPGDVSVVGDLDRSAPMWRAFVLRAGAVFMSQAEIRIAYY